VRVAVALSMDFPKRKRWRFARSLRAAPPKSKTTGPVICEGLEAVVEADGRFRPAQEEITIGFQQASCTLKNDFLCLDIKIN
jgi:hypothetical protein